MRQKAAFVFGLCLCCSVSSFAFGKLPLKGLPNLPSKVASQARFIPKASLSSVVNGYLRTPNVVRFTLPSGEAMRAVRFSRDIKVVKENLLIPHGTLAVVNPKGEISLYKPEEVWPDEIKAGLDAAFEASHPEFTKFMESVEREEEISSAVPWTGRPIYNAQSDIARDIDAYYGGQSEEVVWDIIVKREIKVYRLPSRYIFYRPAGRDGRYLDPEADLILFNPAQNDGQIVFNGLNDTYWRNFFQPKP